MIMYVFFLGLFLACVFFRKMPESYNYIRVQSSRWSNTDPAFGDIDRETAFWEFLEGPFLDTLEYDQDSNNVLKSAPYSGSYMIGSVVMRQKRVLTDECEDHSSLGKIHRNMTKRCHLEFESEKESKETYGNGNFAWTADPQEDINSNLVNPQMGYGLGGFYANFSLPLNRPFAESQINLLKEQNFIDPRTRLLTIERALYEPNSQLVVGIQQELTFDYLGGVEATENYRVAKILQYETSNENTCFYLELLLVYMVFYYVLQEITEMFFLKFEYLSSAWNVIDCLNYSCFIVVFYIRYSVDVAAADLTALVDVDPFVNFNCVLYSFNLVNYCNAFNAILCFLKIFKYLAVHPTLGMLNKVISTAAPDLIGFSFTLVVVMFGFTMAFYMAFGNNLEGYSTISTSCISLFAWALGGFDHGELQDQNSFLGGMFFYLYSLLMMIMLLNFVIAIVSNAFDEVNDNVKECAGEDDEFNQEIRAALHGLSKIFKTVVPKSIRPSSRIVGFKYDSALKLQKMDTIANEEQLAEAIGCETKAKELFDKFDTDGNGFLDKEETEVMKRHVWEKTHREDQQFLTRRLDTMEDGICRLERMMTTLIELPPHSQFSSPVMHRPPSRMDLKNLSKSIASPKSRATELSI